MGHSTSECPNPPTPFLQQKGAEGTGAKGGGRKGKSPARSRAGRFRPQKLPMYVMRVIGASACWKEAAMAESSRSFIEPRSAPPDIHVYVADDVVELPKVEEVAVSVHEVPYSLADTGASTTGCRDRVARARRSGVEPLPLGAAHGAGDPEVQRARWRQERRHRNMDDACRYRRTTREPEVLRDPWQHDRFDGSRRP